MSFAVGNDGSFWILDPVKHRLAQYTRDGRFLGDIGGLPFDRYHPHPRDLAIVGDTPVLLQNGSKNRGILLAPEGKDWSKPVSVHDGGGDLYVSSLIQTADRSTHSLFGLVEGRPYDLGDEQVPKPDGFADLGHSAVGRARFFPGIPLGDGSFVGLRFTGFTDIEATFVTAAGVSTVLPIRLHLKAGREPLSAVASGEFQSALQHGVACLIKIGGESRKPGVRSRDGRWFLELADDGTPLIWERLPEGTFNDNEVVRHLAVGPDGSIYLMLIDAHGVSIYER
jgi:hypothetical protein